MAKIIIIFIVCFASTCAIERDTVAIIDKFSMQVHKVTCESPTNPNGCLLSALSIQHFLALWSTATTNKNITNDFVEHVLLNDTREQVFQDLANISSYLTVATGNTSKAYLLSKLYVTNLGELVPAFGVSLKQFQTPMDRVNFREPESIVNNINLWIKEKSDGMIEALVEPGSFDARTFVVYVSALFLNAKWKQSFLYHATRSVPFQVTKNESYKVPMMTNIGHYLYAVNAELNAQIVEIPYTLEGFRMIIVLPKHVDGLTGVVEKLSISSPYLGERLKRTCLKLSIPKFKIETRLDLISELRKFGLNELLTSPVEELINSADVQIDVAIQKTIVDVNESGTFEAAGTVVVGLLGSPRSESFTADRPFFFAILKYDVLLFTGTLLRPTAVDN